MKKIIEIDDIDKKIISLMLQDAKMPYADIGKKLYISSGTVHVRLKKLIDTKYILGSNLKVDFEKLGLKVTAFLGIFLERSDHYEKVIAELRKIPQVTFAYYTTGTYSIFAQLICKDMTHLKYLLSKKIQKINGISRTETFISLDESINRPPQIIKAE